MIPVTIVGGYLGAGKSSLLNHILRESGGVRFAVLVNDFGAINIDTELIENRSGDTINLSNGCICCSIAGGFGAALLAIRDSANPPDRVIIEASGISDPFKVAQYAHMSGFQLDSVIVMADAENIRSRANDKYVGRQVRQQLHSADLLLLNKIDLVSDQERHDVKTWLHEVSPDVRVVEVTQGRIPIALLFGIHRPATSTQHGHHHHDELYASWSFTTPKILDGAAVRKVIADLDPAVLRGKGFLYLAEDPSAQFIFQLVGARWNVVRGDKWGARKPLSQVVLIGLPDSLDDAVLDAAFERSSQMILDLT